MSAATYINRYNIVGNTALQPQYREDFVVLEGGRTFWPRRSGRIPSDLFQQEERPRLSLVQKLALVLVGVALFVSVFWAAFFMQDVRASAVSDAWASATMQEIVVHSGDTLWDIAQDHAVEGISTSQLVRLIEAENGLDGAGIQPGQRILVPMC